MTANKTAAKESIAKEVIVGAMARFGYEDTDMCRLLGVSANTWRKYKNSPSQMSAGILWVLADTFRFTPAQGAKLALGRDLKAEDFRECVIT